MGCICRNNRKRGVAIAIHQSLWKQVKRVEPRSSRIIKCTMNFQKPMDIIGAYAYPAVTKDRTTKQNINTTTEKKEEFYRELSKCIGESIKGMR